MEKFNYHTGLYSDRALLAMNAIVTRVERQLKLDIMYDVMFDSCHEVIVYVKDDMKHEIRRLIESSCKGIIDEFDTSNDTHVLCMVKQHDINRYRLLASDEVHIEINELHHCGDNYSFMSIPIVDFKFINDFLAGSKDLVSKYSEDYVNMIVGMPNDCITVECTITANDEIAKLENELVEALNEMNIDMNLSRNKIRQQFYEMKMNFIEETIAKISSLKRKCLRDDDN